MTKKLNKDYDEKQKAGIKNLVEHGKYDKATAHTTFDASKVTLPEGVTQETIKTHAALFTDLSGQVEGATAEITRTAHKDNEKIVSTDGTLLFGDVEITSQHHLKDKVGDDYLYGTSVTCVDYVHSAEASEWLASTRENNQKIAQDLFK